MNVRDPFNLHRKSALSVLRTAAAQAATNITERAVDAFKPNQGWGLFRRPAMLARRETVELGRLVSAVEAEPGKKVTKIIHGDRASGKTTLLLQAMSMAFLKGWVVINFPDGALPDAVHERAYWGDNREELRRVKEIWDKDNFFQYQQGILLPGSRSGGQNESLNQGNDEDLTDSYASKQWEVYETKEIRRDLRKLANLEL